MSLTIYDLVTSQYLRSYWEEKLEGEEPYLFEGLFRNMQQLSLEIKYILGAKGLPVVLNQSAFDVQAIPRPRIGFNTMRAMLPYFKESSYIDEELRQRLNMVLETGNRAYIDSIMVNIMDDEMRLLRGARAQRERMRAMAVCTGAVSLAGNGQVYDYNYQIPDEHKVDAKLPWSDPKADICEDILEGKRAVRRKTGATLARAVCDTKTFGYFRKNEIIKKSLFQRTDGVGTITDQMIKNYILDVCGIDIEIDDQMAEVNGVATNFVPADTFVMFPSGILGDFVFGITPEQSDLMSNPNLANVSIVDTGVAICTSKIVDPVQVDTKVSMICLPSMPTAYNIYIIDVNPETGEEG